MFQKVASVVRPKEIGLLARGDLRAHAFVVFVFALHACQEILHVQLQMKMVSSLLSAESQ